jgi:hypothetical protein
MKFLQIFLLIKKLTETDQKSKKKANKIETTEE